MPESDLIPIVHIASGEKFVNEKGITAIKDGVKAGRDGGPRLRKPDWLRIRVQGGANYERVQSIVREHKLATVCEEAKCPNMSECFDFGQMGVGGDDSWGKRTLQQYSLNESSYHYGFSLVPYSTEKGDLDALIQ